jgi:hypothetical protein
VGQGTSLRRRAFLKSGIKLGRTAGAASLALGGCKPSTPVPRGGFIGPSIESGHRLKERATPDATHNVQRGSSSQSSASQASGASLPSSALPGSNPQHQGKTIARQAKIVILGAGIAGLGAAWILRKQGITDVVVLELEAQAGGNSRSHHIQHLACPMGAHYLPVPLKADGRRQGATAGDGLEPVRMLLSDLGLMEFRAGRWQVSAQGERHLCHSPQERLFFRDSWHEGLLPLADVGAASLQAYQRFSELIRGFQEGGGFQLPMGTASGAGLSTTLLSERLSLDTLDFKTWLGRQGLADPHLSWYLDYCCRDDYGAGLDTVSAWAGVHYFASRHGFQAPGESGQEEASTAAGVFTWPQGNGWVSEKISAILGDRLQTERLATRVETIGKGSGKDRGLRITALHAGDIEQWDCQHCILALPLFISQRLIKSSAVSQGTLAALETLSSTIEHSSWLVANAYLDRDLRDRGGAAPAWDNVIYGGQGLGYVNARHQSLEQVNGPTILTYYQALGVGREARKRLLATPWQSWQTGILDDFKGAHPDFRERLQHLDIARFGHAMAVPKPGWHSEALRSARAQLLQADSPVSFAHSDLAGYSVFEEAFTLGVQAGLRAQLLIGKLS